MKKLHLSLKQLKVEIKRIGSSLSKDSASKEPTSAAPSSFQYEDLEHQQIRLLQLQPDSNSAGTLSATCSHTPLSQDSVPRYIAVSYFWGDPTPTHNITLNGLSFGITKTLFDFLMRMSKSTENTPLWIDAICVNQNDLTERAEQVKLMREIYSKAAFVQIWLGEASEDSNAAIDFVKELEEIFLNTPRFLRPENTISRLLERTNEWRTFGRLVERPWFSRIWVVQEVALASKASILCGGKQMDWHRFARVVEALDQQSLGGLLLSQDDHEDLQTAVMPIGWPSIRDIQGARDTVTRKKLLSLGETIDIFIGFNATDPRDKVFALLGIVEDRDDEAWQPDYRKPVEKLYEEVTETLMRKEGGLRLLSYAGTGDNRAKKSLPSWVPDYSVRTSAVPFRGGTAGGQNSLCSFSFHLSPQGPKRLHARARILSPLLELGPPHEVSEVSSPGTKNGFFNWYLETAKIFCKPEVEAQFWRALVANQFQAPEDIGPYPDEDWFFTCFESFKDIFQQVYDSTLPATEQLYNAREVDKAQAFRNPMIVATLGRRMCSIELDLGNKSERKLGLAPRGAEVGDLICVFNGANVPFIVRRIVLNENAGNEEYEVVGECYIHGLAGGEALRTNGLEEKEIVLV